jgi:hypothetical protein
VKVSSGRLQDALGLLADDPTWWLAGDPQKFSSRA